MQVFILTLGTRGDFELFLALGEALRRRGHRVVLGASPFYAGEAREARVEWEPIGDGTREELVAILRSLAPIPDKTRRTHLYYARWLRPQLSRSTSRVTAIGTGADYFISNLKMMLERDGAVIPGAAVTYDPPLAVEDLPRYGTQRHGGHILDLVAMSKALVDPDDRWGAAYRFTGFWATSPRSDWTPSPELAGFLESGPPPVVVTLGSMVMFDSGTLVRDVGEALRLCGQRGVVLGGWSGIAAADASAPWVRGEGDVPYDWLFPRASCVIHHGGCGTVAAVLRAGRPSILLPQIACQEEFGRMLVRERLATGVFDAARLSPRELAAAIETAVTSEPVRESARRWQGVVAAERGVEAAADLVEAHRAELRR